MTGQISVPDDFDRIGKEEIGLLESGDLQGPTAFSGPADTQHMKTLTITAARRRFGTMLDSVLHQPVLITRRNKTRAVIMSAELYDRLTGATSFEPAGAKPAQRKATSSKRR